jgi:very-short-patch-repair endonuclease
MNETYRTSPELRRRAQELRRNATPEEEALWEQIRARRFLGTRWLRQYPTAGYILDFYCAKAKLVVELDGSQHLLPDAVEYDAARTAYVNLRGWQEIRFPNRQVTDNIESVLRRIERALTEPRTLSPNPSPARGRGASHGYQ